MQQNYYNVLGSPVVWDNTSQYQISVYYGVANVNYTYVPTVLDDGDLYFANGTVTPTIGLAPASDPGWTALTGGSATMLGLPENQIYIGGADGMPHAMPMTGDVSIDSSGDTSISDATVTGKALTGFVSATGTITAADTILSGIEKNFGNLASLSSLFTFTAGTGTPQINYAVLGRIVIYAIYDASSFATIGGGTTGPTAPVTYILPQPAQGNVNNIIGVYPALQTTFTPSGAGGGNISAWSNTVNNTNPSVSVVAFNTTSSGISDGTMWTLVIAALV